MLTYHTMGWFLTQSKIKIKTEHSLWNCLEECISVVVLLALFEMMTLSTVLEVDKGDFTNNSISGEESANVREQKEKGNPGMFKLNMMAPKDWALWF